MKKIALVACAAAALTATPVLADVTGTINLTGTVAAKCFVQPNSGSTFGTTVAFGELAQADGTLRTDLASAFSTIGAAGLSARVVCTSGAPSIAISTTPLADTTVAAPTGYANTINYQANVAVTTVVDTKTYSSDTSTSPTVSATALDGRLANTGTNNIVVSASNFRTPGTNALLVASNNYAGKITVVIAPN